jgi:predicted 3-demethylubiquinone-9 3-methyltransferase (glyoxalase superfamily)
MHENTTVLAFAERGEEAVRFCVLIFKRSRIP